MSFTERLIEYVKARPVLYDIRHPDFKHFSEKDKVWREMGRELKQDSEELKKKWKNIKDCYQKHLRTVNTKSGVPIKRSYRNWQWAAQMEFCRPHAESSIRDSDSNGYSENQVDALQSSNEDSQGFENTPSVRDIIFYDRNKRKNDAGGSTPDDRQSKRQHFIPSDATDLIFLGYSQTIKTLSPMRQAIVKMRIAQIIMEEELNNLEETSSTPPANKASARNSESVSCDNQPCSSGLNTEISLKREESELY